jgi:hypothetical protein
MVSYTYEEINGVWTLVRHCDGDCSVALLGNQIEIVQGPMPMLVVPDHTIPEPSMWMVLILAATAFWWSRRFG